MNYILTRSDESYVIVEDTLKVNMIEISTFPGIRDEVTHGLLVVTLRLTWTSSSYVFRHRSGCGRYFGAEIIYRFREKLHISSLPVRKKFSITVRPGKLPRNFSCFPELPRLGGSADFLVIKKLS